MSQLHKKRVKRAAIRESMVDSELDNAIAQFDGGADEAMEAKDNCILETAKIPVQ